MFVDPDADDTLADDVFYAMERARAEGHKDEMAVLACLWTAMHSHTVAQLVHAIRPYATRNPEALEFVLPLVEAED